MAILKYTNANGQTVKVNSYKVNNLIPQQTKGDNPNAVMSQKAVTDEVNEIGLQINEVTGKITAVKATADKAASDLTALTQTVNTKANQSALDALTTTVNGKANAKDVYTKTEADGKYLTAADIADINTDLTEIHNTLGDMATTDDLGELENIVSLKAAKSALEAEVTRATAKEGELNTAIGTKAASADLTSEINRAKAAEKANTDRIETLENIREIDCGKF